MYFTFIYVAYNKILILLIVLYIVYFIKMQIYLIYGNETFTRPSWRRIMMLKTCIFTTLAQSIP